MQQNKKIIERLFSDVLNRKDPAAINEIISPDYIEQDTFPGQMQGIKGIEQRLNVIFNSFPDAEYIIKEMISEGEKISVSWIMKGTFKNKFLNYEPTNIAAEMKGIDIYSIKDGQIITHTNVVDLSGL
ncbi:MAG: ester cyclase [Ignavibacteria bacterium]|nr:ester cyclase [Ignavibacteria bacterium]